MKEDPEYYDDPADYYYEYDEKNHWLLNVSLLVPFKELRSLNLSGNVIGGCLPNQGMFSPGPLLSLLCFSYWIPLSKQQKKILNDSTEVSFFSYNI